MLIAQSKGDKKMENITEILYDRYRLKWCIEHNIGIKDLFQMCEDTEIYDADKAIVEYNGFNGGESWAFYDEFMDNEFTNKEEMRKLCNNEAEFRQYLHYCVAEEQEEILYANTVKCEDGELPSINSFAIQDYINVLKK